MVKLFWLQPRKTFALDHRQRGLHASVIRMTYAKDDFEAADLELLDLSAPAHSNDRACRVYDFAGLPLLAEQEVAEIFANFGSAYDIVCGRGVERPQRPPKRKDVDVSKDSLSSFRVRLISCIPPAFWRRLRACRNGEKGDASIPARLFGSIIGLFGHVIFYESTVC
jgi:hypothetical protein